jgi:galactokinase
MSREIIASAPGRVCFAGEDIDWISGPSILCAIDLKTNVLVKENGGGSCFL